MANSPRLIYYHRLKNFSFENGTVVCGVTTPDNWSASYDGDGSSTFERSSTHAGLFQSYSLKLQVAGTDTYIMAVSDSITAFAPNQEYTAVIYAIKGSATAVSGTLYLEGLDAGDSQTEVASVAFTLSATAFTTPQKIEVSRTFSNASTAKIRVIIEQTTAAAAYYDHCALGIGIDLGVDYSKSIGAEDFRLDTYKSISKTADSYQTYVYATSDRYRKIRFNTIDSSSGAYDKLRYMFEEYMSGDSFCEPFFYWLDYAGVITTIRQSGVIDLNRHYFLIDPGGFHPALPPGVERIIIEQEFLELPWSGLNDI